MGSWLKLYVEKDETVAGNRAQVLIVGMSGRMQESLRSLLKAVPDIEVLLAEKGSLSVTETGSGQQPDLVLLDFCRPTPELMQDLDWVKSHWPGTNCLVLADTARQQQLAKAAGADGVLLRGFAMPEFFSMLRDMLRGTVWLEIEPPQPARPMGGETVEPGRSLLSESALLANPAVF
jgi:DNA-binding NarL/FixJ family response regulator